MYNFKFNLYLSVFLVLLVCRIAQGQDNTFVLSLDYSPNYSYLSNEIVQEDGKFSHNAFAKIEFPFSQSSVLTTGLGFMNFGIRIQSDLDDFEGIQRVEILSNFNYIVIPTGVKFRFKNFFIQPETSVGILVREQEKFIKYFTDGGSEIEKRHILLGNGELSKVVIPVFMTTGLELPFEKWGLMFGIRGYYSLNQLIKNVPRKNNFYGLGLVFGSSF